MIGTLFPGSPFCVCSVFVFCFMSTRLYVISERSHFRVFVITAARVVLFLFFQACFLCVFRTGSERASEPASIGRCLPPPLFFQIRFVLLADYDQLCFTYLSVLRNRLGSRWGSCMWDRCGPLGGFFFSDCSNRPDGLIASWCGYTTSFMCD